MFQSHTESRQRTYAISSTTLSTKEHLHEGSPRLYYSYLEHRYSFQHDYLKEKKENISVNDIWMLLSKVSLTHIMHIACILKLDSEVIWVAEFGPNVNKRTTNLGSNSPL